MAKEILIVRHGESEYNKWRRESFTKLRVRDMLKQDPGIRDPALTAEGRRQAESLEVAFEPDLVVVSPLRRSIETALLIFGKSAYAGKFVVHPSIAEQLDTEGDCGMTLREMRESSEFADRLDFSSWESLFPDSLDTPWWFQGNAGGYWHPWRSTPPEPASKLDERIAAFCDWLQERPEKHIAVVGHAYFIKRWTQQSRKLRHCESLRFFFKRGLLEGCGLEERPGGGAGQKRVSS